MILLLIAIYLVGCVLAYRQNRSANISEFREWTVGDRRVALVMSAILSWIWFLVCFIMRDNGKPAKW
jgi:uncharacterized BrkB/YihY/UPF0761 family membrane protein